MADAREKSRVADAAKAREKRLKAALKSNMAKRKAQARARARARARTDADKEKG